MTWVKVLGEGFLPAHLIDMTTIATLEMDLAKVHKGTSKLLFYKYDPTDQFRFH